jgi:glycoside/pentoside/hexuronide:cation symporter, GPH family
VRTRSDGTGPAASRASSMRGDRLGRGTYVGYGIGSVGTGIFSTVPGLLLLTFMVRQLAVPPALAGFVILAPRLWDMVTDPIAGSLSDRTRTRIGPRRPWLLAGSLTLPVAFALLFRVPELSGPQAAVYVLVVYLFGATAFTVFQVPYVALPAEMTDDYDERTTILAYRIAFLTVGILIAGAAAPQVLRLGGGGRDGYALMGLSIGAVLFVVLFVAFVGTRRIPLVDPGRATATFREQLRAARQNGPFFWLLSAFVIQALGVGAMLAGVDFFAAYVLEDADQTAILFACLVAPALVTMPLWAWVGHRWGKRTGYTICIVLFGVGGFALLAASPDRLLYVYVVVFLMGCGYAGTQMFPLAMLPDTIAADTHRTGMRRAGAYTGVWTAGEKAGFAIGPAVLASLLAVTGFVETEGGAIVDQPPSALTGIVIGFAIVPAVVVLGSLLLLRRYDLDEATVRSFAGADGVVEVARAEALPVAPPLTAGDPAGKPHPPPGDPHPPPCDPHPPGDPHPPPGDPHSPPGDPPQDRN